MSDWIEARREQRLACCEALRGLINGGMQGLPVEALWADVRRVFAEAGEPITFETFLSWTEGRTFPAYGRRRGLLADAVGGAYGDQIKRLRWPTKGPKQ